MLLRTVHAMKFLLLAAIPIGVSHLMVRAAVKLEDIHTNESIERRGEVRKAALRTCVEARAYMLTPANG
jgi:hypothetical protein